MREVTPETRILAALQEAITKTRETYEAGDPAANRQALREADNLEDVLVLMGARIQKKSTSDGCLSFIQEERVTVVDGTRVILRELYTGSNGKTAEHIKEAT